jgi:hypothetical protein
MPFGPDTSLAGVLFAALIARRTSITVSRSEISSGHTTATDEKPSNRCRLCFLPSEGRRYSNDIALITFVRIVLSLPRQALCIWHHP